jgi:hypothetical protein
MPSPQGEAPQDCAALARAENVLDVLDHDLLRAGLVPERLPAARLIYLAVVSRLHDRPVSIVLKAPSSAGKSWLIKKVLELCPSSSYYALSSMSERALAYSDVDLRHRMLVIYEADGLASDFGTYLIRTLLSEGEIRYETVESGKGGLKPKVIHRPGPTGLLTSTTRISLHPENETRLFSVAVTDSQDSQRAVFARWGAEAAGDEAEAVDSTCWHALGSWLEVGERRVVIPYAKRLAELLPAHALRMQRDWVATLALVRACALLHRATRGRDHAGRIIAVMDDYRHVRDLVEPIVAAGVEAAVKASVRQTVEAVAKLLSESPAGVDQRALRFELQLDRAAVSRRVADAIACGYLRDGEDRGRGYPSRLVLDQPMPVDGEVLPRAEALE